MAGFNLQFHMLPEELSETVKEWTNDPRLYVLGTDAALKKVVCWSGAEELLDLKNLPERVFFALEALGTPVVPLLSFVQRHKDWLVLSIGARRSDCLEESQLSTQTSNTEILKVWREFAKQLECQLKRGAWVVNRRPGTFAFYPNIRYSAGTAKALESTRLRAVFLGGNELRLTKPEESSTC